MWYEIVDVGLVKYVWHSEIRCHSTNKDKIYKIKYYCTHQSLVLKSFKKNKPKEPLFKTLHRLEDNLQLGMI